MYLNVYSDKSQWWSAFMLSELYVFLYMLMCLAEWTESKSDIL